MTTTGTVAPRRCEAVDHRDHRCRRPRGFTLTHESGRKSYVCWKHMHCSSCGLALEGTKTTANRDRMTHVKCALATAVDAMEVAGFRW